MTPSLISGRERFIFVESDILLLVGVDLKHFGGGVDTTEVSEVNLTKATFAEEHIGQGQLVFRDFKLL